jgi:uncharacterized integral membrane protein (TIGR00698 family)
MWSGLLVTVVIALVASGAGRLAPLAGAPVLALLFGIAIRSSGASAPRFDAGIRFSAKVVLPAAIVLSGFGLSFAMVVRTGLATLPVTIVTIAVALACAPVLGRLLRVETGTRALIAIGTAICGASAIAAVASVTDPPEEDVALSIATIFTYNIIAVLVFPPIGHLLHLSQDAFGVWAGTAVNDTSSVVAAGYAYGREAGAYATVVKLTRATCILPVVGVLAMLRARTRAHAGGRVPWRRIVPWFIVWFLCAALVNTAGLVRPDWHEPIAHVSTFLIAVALAGIGLQTNLRHLVTSGARPLALGGVLWVLVAVASLLVQHLTGT